VVLQTRDRRLNFLSADAEPIDTQTPYQQSAGVAWNKIRPDPFADIALRDVRSAIEARRGAK
jgi:hypothetical protein